MRTVHGLTWDDVKRRHGLETTSGIGDGWAGIVDRLFTDLEEMGWRWTPITELYPKYGELCFTAGNADNPPSYEGWPQQWEDRIEEPERESERTCDTCGRPGGEVIIDAWVYKFCAACADDRRRLRRG